MGDFEKTLTDYRSALLDAKVKGDTSAAVRAQTLKGWLDSYLQNTQGQISKTQKTIQAFVDEYAGSTSDIEDVRQKFKEVRARGPVLQDVYETDKRSMQSESYDFSPLYAKSALVVGLAVVSVLVWRRI
jgi:peptidoglycan hydrolase CwlO-like protein